MNTGTVLVLPAAVVSNTVAWAECVDRYLPELVPTWQRLASLTVADPSAVRC